VLGEEVKGVLGEGVGELLGEHCEEAWKNHGKVSDGTVERSMKESWRNRKGLVDESGKFCQSKVLLVVELFNG
jgi:hypothetical protein